MKTKLFKWLSQYNHFIQQISLGVSYHYIAFIKLPNILFFTWNPSARTLYLCQIMSRFYWHLEHSEDYTLSESLFNQGTSIPFLFNKLKRKYSKESYKCLDFKTNNTLWSSRPVPMVLKCYFLGYLGILSP